MDEVSFDKGHVKFWVYEDGDDLILEVSQMKWKKFGGGILGTTVDSEELEYIKTKQASMIMKTINKIVNDKSLQKERCEFLRERAERVEKVIQDMEMREMTEGYKETVYMRKRKQLRELKQELLVCSTFIEHEITLEGKENKVLVTWYRGTSKMYPSGVEYSIHTKTDNGLIWGHYYKNIVDALGAFEKYRIPQPTDTEKAMLKWGLSKEEVKNFIDYLENKCRIHVCGYGDNLSYFKNIYRFQYGLGKY
ncbi:hypothetical protein [Romboutsia sp.]|uniref:hypothetical protein n=1 Tax=Romboutsia sp. TaxID=1965302 RepID=UPI002C1FB48B|nr:hypothetical protein [Romboutsia sp.]HSQ89367.1 hypothetical protein [Romboutsia sp.]